MNVDNEEKQTHDIENVEELEFDEECTEDVGLLGGSREERHYDKVDYMPIYKGIKISILFTITILVCGGIGAYLYQRKYGSLNGEHEGQQFVSTLPDKSSNDSESLHKQDHIEPTYKPVNSPGQISAGGSIPNTAATESTTEVQILVPPTTSAQTSQPTIAGVPMTDADCTWNETEHKCNGEPLCEYRYTKGASGPEGICRYVPEPYKQPPLAPVHEFKSAPENFKGRIGWIIPFIGKGMSHWSKLVGETMIANADVCDYIIITEENSVMVEESENVIVHRLPKGGILGKVRKWIEENLGMDLNQTDPAYFKKWGYKIVDVKPMYGSMFKEYIPEDKYSHWGYCDLDVIWGKLSLFVTNDLLWTFDAIGYQDYRRGGFFFQGPFTVCRNDEIGRELWTIMNRDTLIDLVQRHGITSVDEHTFSSPLVVYTNISVVMIYGAMQHNKNKYPYNEQTWTRENGHLVLFDKTVNEMERRPPQGKISDYVPKWPGLAKTNGNLIQYPNNAGPTPWFGWAYFYRINENNDSTTWYMKPMDLATINPSKDHYEVGFHHFYGQKGLIWDEMKDGLVKINWDVENNDSIHDICSMTFKTIHPFTDENRKRRFHEWEFEAC